VVAPPPTPTREEDSFFFDSIHDAHFSLFVVFQLDTNWDGRGHRRQVNQILGNLIHLHYPELVTKGGHSEPVTTWHDYARAPDARVGNAQGVVRHAFWVSLYMFINFVISCNTYFLY
jgi:hypothetical protein